jgi:hypothetical protein
LNAPAGYLRYTPAKGWTSILSQRRQARKQMTAAFPALRSGRQWTKYRKAAKRLHVESNGKRGFDFYSLPTYTVV